MRNLPGRVARFATLALGATLLSAHVGSPDAVFEGRAGPYGVRVIVKAPPVIPARAEVIVRVTEGRGVTRVVAAPYIWNGGDAGAPPPDALARVAGDSSLWSGQLWIMAPTSYSIRVTVAGAAGEGTAAVPFAALPTRVLGMDRGLALGLAAFGALLVAGFVTLVGVASSEATLEPGVAVDASRRRRGWIARGAAAGIVTALLVLGRLWWGAEEAAYARNVYAPTRALVSVGAEGGARRLALAIDTATLHRRRASPLIPDHGRMMHLFAIREDLGAMAHLHPAMRDSLHFAGALPDLPPGRYRVFADVVRETGYAETLVGAFAHDGGGPATPVADRDDATFTGAPTGATVRFADGSTLTRTGAATPLRAGAEATLAFVLRDATGAERPVEPYLGMAAHAVVVRDAFDVFVHLHPVGTASMAAQRALLERTAADTARGALARRLAADTLHAGHGMDAERLPGRFAFPYAFPKAGRYRVWVQFRIDGAVRTAAFEVRVA